MRSTNRNRHGAARMIVALLGFVAVLCLAAAAGFARKGQLLNLTALFAKKSPDLPPAEPLFYTSIGNAALSLAKAPGQEPPEEYTLEVEVTQNRAAAETAVSGLAKAGLNAYFTPLHQQGKVVYRVRSGVYATSSQAQSAALGLKQQNIAAAVVKLQ